MPGSPGIDQYNSGPQIYGFEAVLPLKNKNTRLLPEVEKVSFEVGFRDLLLLGRGSGEVIFMG